MSFWHDPKFKQLEKKWYKKISKDFQDIENTNNETRLLKEWDSNFFRNNFNEIKYEATVQYYKNARRLLLTYPFENKTHEEIWRLHCEGITEREIAKRIRRYKKSMVHYLISNISRLIKKE